jgi:hypothetical protein
VRFTYDSRCLSRFLTLPNIRSTCILHFSASSLIISLSASRSSSSAEAADAEEEAAYRSRRFESGFRSLSGWMIRYRLIASANVSLDSGRAVAVTHPRAWGLRRSWCSYGIKCLDRTRLRMETSTNCGISTGFWITIAYLRGTSVMTWLHMYTI